jgi:hypothetical protein
LGDSGSQIDDRFLVFACTKVNSSTQEIQAIDLIGRDALGLNGSKELLGP